MRNVLLTVLVLAVAGCESLLTPDLVDVSGKLVDRAYLMRGCEGSPGPDGSTLRGLPCTTYVSGSSFFVTDSGRLELHSDGTARWMLGATRRVNPCYLMGTNCATTTISVDTAAATYRIAKDSVVVRLYDPRSGATSILILRGSIPDRVASGWAGPDSLAFSLSPANVAYTGILKP